jgi:hypothetical protein
VEHSSISPEEAADRLAVARPLSHHVRQLECAVTSRYLNVIESSG